MIVILYLFITFVLVYIPDHCWIYCIDVFNRWKKKRLSYRFERFCSFMQQRAYGRDLSKGEELPQYKFYTSLLVELLDQCRRFGSPISGLIQSLREIVIKDYQFERRVSGEAKGASVQFFFTAMITWIFVFSTKSVVGIRPSLFIVLLMLGWQGLGVMIFFYSYKRGKSKGFACHESYLVSLLKLKSLSQVGVSTQQCITMSNIAAVIKGKLPSINDRVELALERWQKNGVPLGPSIDEAIGELFFLMGEAFKRFHLFVTMTKFTTLSLFYLPCYLFYIFWIFRSYWGE